MGSTWVVENIEDKPNSREGRTAKLVCYDKNGHKIGWCYIEGWLYGCALMGLSHLSSLPYCNSAEDEKFTTFLEFLERCHVTFGQGADFGTRASYMPRRYMFTTAGGSGGMVHLMEEASQKVITFKNRTHSSAPNVMYFLNLGKED